MFFLERMPNASLPTMESQCIDIDPSSTQVLTAFQNLQSMRPIVAQVKRGNSTTVETKYPQTILFFC